MTFLTTKSEQVKLKSVKLYSMLAGWYTILPVNSLTVTDTASKYLVIKQKNSSVHL